MTVFLHLNTHLNNIDFFSIEEDGYAHKVAVFSDHLWNDIRENMQLTVGTVFWLQVAVPITFIWIAVTRQVARKSKVLLHCIWQWINEAIIYGHYKQHSPKVYQTHLHCHFWHSKCKVSEIHADLYKGRKMTIRTEPSPVEAESMCYVLRHRQLNLGPVHFTPEKNMPIDINLSRHLGGKSLTANTPELSGPYGGISSAN